MSLLTKPDAAYLPLPTLCKVPTCPLNEAGIHHNIGIYKQHDVSPTRGFFSVLFGSSNPPDFIWYASEERKNAMEKVRRGDHVEMNSRIVGEKEELIGRFLDLHAGCGESDF
ncbi:hypothetical protein LOCC1_G002058 [Lachnellula occidentalis]|uniref:Uncharacterized protein n=1 Tax=Lachnellula occidentalis TaxID=215460 RepID=A0A8H8S638_9HELO|nr:hypothetical protein LOCC1_G002058 [Lachnellula occidentalis]